ncbi:helix-turn-helix domain-containing protein [Actinomadura sp. NPDC047616]|uniref:helix-turn-helix domain-containing protein n=1 Tax=Actinomadura sp. NPDC047616 TaxID=3155914 RepID=UPI0033BFF8FF
MGVARYREDPAPPGSGLVCLWSHEVAPDAGSHVQRVVPDGCVDLIWWSEDARVTVAGPDTGPHLPELRPGERLVAIRFGPGAAPPVLGMPADAVRDGRLPLRDLWGADADRLGEAMAGSSSPHAVLTKAALARAEGPPDPIVPAVVRALSRGEPVREVADMLGLGERQLRRRALAAFGYGPKTLQRVLRFQRALARARAGEPLAGVAHGAGYADQAHLAHDVRDLAGVPISALL